MKDRIEEKIKVWSQKHKNITENMHQESEYWSDHEMTSACDTLVMIATFVRELRELKDLQ